MSLTTYDEPRLIELTRSLALKFGEFRLASGQTAQFYLDCRKLTLDGEGANQVAAGMIELLRQTGWPDCLGGMAIGADPITAAVITCAWQIGLPLRGFIVRKEPKSHGTGQQVEGPVSAGDRAVIVEDVVTSGGSSLAAIDRARQAGLLVDRCLAIIDRQQGGAEALSAAGVTLHSLLTAEQLGLNGN
ncbi:MAG TPA: orotate phosphoribosyltransferase [Pirellulaceae bacterium]|nr:orotate phosphoribosyltransferase [Pirellulaceae bacterium]